MNTQALTQAYDKLIAAARRIEANPYISESDRENVDWRLCHIALSDEILIAAAQATLDEQIAVVDNCRAMDARVIASLMERSTLSDRIELVRHNGDAFIARIASLAEGHGTIEVHLIVHDKKGAVVSNAVMSWYELINLRAERHLPAHTKSLAFRERDGSQLAALTLPRKALPSVKTSTAD
ncbi:hypothetical protein [Advenella sp. FME57]|uniref:hypothetical protein n=1 Tax=Advenella sp. FME57 TaxID=2742604 RepID=UPI001865D4A0|nr:hypothetical protein [Advenella sp. FME57]